MILGPLFGAYAVAAALVKRDRTGEGSYIDISCSDAVVASSWPKATGLLNEAKLQPSDDVATFPKGGLPAAAKYTYYQTSDEKYVLFCCIEKKFWDNFCIAAGRPDLCPWHSKQTVVDYGEDDFELMDELQRVFHTKTQAEWVEIFRTQDIPAGPALTIAEVPDDPHLQARGIIVDEHHPVIGDLRVDRQPDPHAGRDVRGRAPRAEPRRAHRRDPRRPRVRRRRARRAAHRSGHLTRLRRHGHAHRLSVSSVDHGGERDRRARSSSRRS